MKEVLISENKVYLEKNFMITELNVPNSSIKNGLRKGKKNKQLVWQSFPFLSNEYIDYDSIDKKAIERHKIPSKDELKVYDIKNDFDNKIHNGAKINSTYLLLNDAFTTKFTQFVPIYLEKGYNVKMATKIAKTHALIHQIFLLKKNGVSFNELFQQYKIFYPLYFSPKKLQYFYKKFSEIKSVEDISNTLINKNKGKVSNRSKLTDVHRAILRELYRDPKNTTAADIKKIANQQFLNLGISQLSYSTVRFFLGTKETLNSCRRYRQGKSNTRNELLPYLKRAQPKYVGDLWQIDGVRFNIGYLEKNSVEFMVLMIVIDVKSMKIIGFAIGHSENHELAAKAISMAIKTTGYLPYEIQSDNASAFIKKEFLDIKREFYIRGCNWRKCMVDNPRDKSQVERLFKTLNISVFKKSPFFYGDGIQSKDKNGKPNSELLKIMRKNPDIPTKSNIANIAESFIEEYNGMEINGKVCPNVKYGMEKPKNVFNVKEADIAFMFLSRKEIQIEKSMIVFTIDGIQYTYSLKDFESIIKYGYKSKVIVKYDPSDLNKIFIFDLKTEKYLCTLEREIEVKMAMANQTKSDIRKIHQYSKKMDEYFDKMKNIRKEDIKVIDKTYSKIPLQLANHALSSKEQIKEAEDNFYRSLTDSIHLNNQLEEFDTKKKRKKRADHLPKKSDVTPKIFNSKGNLNEIKSNKDE
ncbi:MAG: DDE-type integrase/transposase/recombinase [Salinivirgaceae bacterium]|nr:DDE-type integrase/transposase/recombinase [Salinivirgaceae bacterium]